MGFATMEIKKTNDHERFEINIFFSVEIFDEKPFFSFY
jgi:hypothetical protein